MKIIVFAAAMAVSLAAAVADPVAWKLETPPAAVKPGARFHLKLVATVNDGWHMYSLKPMAEGPIPARIWIPEGQPFTLAGAVQAPDPQIVRDPSFGMEVEIYEGEAVFTLPVKVAAGAAPGARTLVVSASYQSCNDKLCLPPKTVKVEVPISIGK
jgi:thiol:disulfide interchange protein DsbD